jgi:ElaB/YqjD/DUF883 family membrane-anchored ribosome-binding protein
MASSRSESFPGLSSVQDSIRGLRSEGEKVFSQGLKEAQKLIGKDRQKVFKDWTGWAKAVRKDIHKRADGALKSLRSQADKLRSDLDSRARKSIEPIIRRLSLPTKHEVDQLAKRLSSLEKKVDQLLSARP